MPSPPPLTFDAEDLDPIQPDDSDITPADIDAAVAQWEDTPPDSRFANILDATVIDD
jgi:hypothetical protein